jgi:predicted dehydrogenase
VGGAPDTFMGAGIQTCRKIIEEGKIGRPVAATAFMLCRGHETWHPDPAFYYQFGGGPMFDMGPYYVTALVTLLGKAESVSGMTGKAFETRTITSEPLNGTVVKVEVPTHYAGQILFKNGAIGTIIQSFDVYKHNLPLIEIYGTEGTLCVPDPNYFDGPVKIYDFATKSFTEIPLEFPYTENSRGLGVSNMAESIVTGNKPQADIALTFHVLEIMASIETAAKTGRAVGVGE